VDLKSTNDLLLESNLKYENLLNDHKVLENNYMEVSTPLTSIKDDNTCLAHKVNTLNLLLSLESGKKEKLSNLNAELNKLKNINGVLKKCASKFEVQYKEVSANLAKCVLEKDNLIEQMEVMEMHHVHDFNAIAVENLKLREFFIQSSKDPPC